jgi:hypothetical protein
MNTNELFSQQLIKQLLRSINQNPNGLIQFSKRVFVLPKNKDQPNKENLNRDNINQINKNVRLYCTTNAFPVGSVKWYKKTSHTSLEPIITGIDDLISHYSLEFNSNVLKINNPKIKDSGLFIAILNNRFHPNEFNVKCAIQLVVREPFSVEVKLLNPLNSIKNKDLDHNLDSSSSSTHISINCTVYGYPTNQILFYHNGLLLDTVLLSSNNNNNFIKSLSDEPLIKSYTLSLNPTYFSSNSITEMNGIYQCFAINDYEIETGSYILMQTRKYNFFLRNL